MGQEGQGRPQLGSLEISKQRISHVRQREWKRRNKKRVLRKIGKIIITEIITIIVRIIITKVGTRIVIESVKEIVKETEQGIDREIKSTGTSEKRRKIERIQGKAEAVLEKEVTQKVEGI